VLVERVFEEFGRVGKTHQAVFVSGDIDRDDLLKAEVPFEVRDNERRNEASARCIHVDGAINVLFDKQIIDSLDIFILAGIGRANNSTDTNRVLIYQLDSLFGIDHVAVFRAVDVAVLDLEVSCCFLPADLHGRVHDNVGFRIIFAFGFALVLPAFLHCEGSCQVVSIFLRC